MANQFLDIRNSEIQNAPLDQSGQLNSEAAKKPFRIAKCVVGQKWPTAIQNTIAKCVVGQKWPTAIQNIIAKCAAGPKWPTAIQV